jgi:divalent metal cation (Fe/Co/Zn/Cd) transporter
MEGDIMSPLKKVLILSIITIIYNTGEGLVSVFFGFEDETLALFGFGVDSFVEVISGIGILHMVFRMKHSEINERDRFERTALRVTGSAFYLLGAGLTAGAVITIVTDARPETTFWGIVISSVSILTMWLLIRLKVKAGTELKSDAVIADAECTRACLRLSFVLLASSLLYELLHIPYADAAGSLIIAWLAFKEGKESFGKAKSGDLSCCCDGSEDSCQTTENR